MRRLPAADGAGRGRGRRARERAGAGARARVRWLRHPPREPDARPRSRACSGCARNDASVHARSGGGPLRRGGRAARADPGRDARRLLLVALTGRAGCRRCGGRRSSRVRPTRRRSTARCAVRLGPRVEGARASRDRNRCRCVGRRRCAGRRGRVGARLGRGAGLRDRDLLDRPWHRRHWIAARPRRPRGCGRGQRGERARRISCARGAGFRAGRAGETSRSVAPHARCARARHRPARGRVAGRSRGAGLARAAR